MLPEWYIERFREELHYRQVCRLCQYSFSKSEHDYEAARNVCFGCLQKLISRIREFTFLGNYEKKEEEKTITVTLFQETETGFVYSYRSNEDIWINITNPHQDIEETAKYWGFFLPTILDDENTIQKYDNDNCELIGDFRVRPAIAFRFDNHCGLKCSYLLYKDGESVDVTIIRGAIRAIEQRARAFAHDIFGEEKRLKQRELHILMAEVESQRIEAESSTVSLSFEELHEQLKERYREVFEEHQRSE